MSLARYLRATKKQVKVQQLNTWAAYSTTIKDLLGSGRRLDGNGKGGLSDEAADRRDVTVNGWIKSTRKMKSVAFAAVGDGTTAKSLQAILPRENAMG